MARRSRHSLPHRKTARHAKTILNIFLHTSILIPSTHSPITSLSIAITDAIGGLQARQIAQISCSGLSVGWLTQGNHATIKPSLGSLKSGLASRSGECRSSHTHKNAQAPQTASRCWRSGGDSRGKRGRIGNTPPFPQPHPRACLLYTSDAADE